ncbi:MAG TPA: glycoside hydrolase family 99-like domain-containing protein, partial [Phenylobacterium sp.]
ARDPHPLFNVGAYRRQRGAALRGEPLADYLSAGARAKKNPSPLFRPDYYLEQAGDRPLAHANPLMHYLSLGAFEGLWPAPDFDEPAYFAAHPDAAASPLSGLEHWARHRTERPAAGAAAGRVVSAEALFADLRRAADPDPEAYGNEDFAALRRPLRHAAADPAVRVIAIRRSRAPDWTAVAHALPNYRGHLQPRLPADGFTDPADPATLARDVALAERYGLGAFCHEVASAADAQAVCGPKAAAFPYCLAWSGPNDAAKAIAALAAALEGALRIDGRPVLLLSRAADPAAWRKAAPAPGLFLIQRGGRPADGFDARLADVTPPRAPEGPPGPVVNPDFRGLVHDALALIGEEIDRPDDAIPLVVCAHDTSPLSQDAPTVWQGASPGAFQAWLQAARDRAADAVPQGRLVFVHAWNDWETGAALAPDLRFGHGWLEALANAADAELLTAPPEAAQ